MNIEKRTNALELRFSQTNSGQTIAGYAAVFNSPTDIGGYFEEVIAPGAFADWLTGGNDVLALYSHELERLLGRRSAGTLRINEDNRGLAIEIDLPDTSDGRDVGVLVSRGDLKGMSFGFVATREEWDETRNPPRRTIMTAEVYEVTVTAMPAYPDTEVAMRSLEKVRGDRAPRDQAERNASAAASRIAERKARMEQSFRGIRPENTR